MSEIDRGASISRGRKGSKLLRITIVTLIVTFLFASSLSLLSDPSSEAPPAPVPAGIVSLPPHAPIYIEGNAGFLVSNATTGISWGNGTADNPYIIEAWDINASAANGVMIRNSDVHFVVRDCHVYDNVTEYMAIYLYNCTNGIISGNNCTSSPYGIYLHASSNNTLINNDCSVNGRGIYLLSSSNNTLINNTCSSNTIGINLGSSSNNTLINNYCSVNGNGIYLLSSSNNNTLSDSTCSQNTNNGIEIDSSNGNTLINNTYTYNTNSGILVYNSNANKLLGNNASNNQFGIYLWLGGGTTVTNNTVSNNSQYGMRINSAPDNIISNNTVSNNVHYAVYVWNAASRNNRIWNNTFYHNNGSGDTYIQSKNQALDSGGVNWWNSTNGYGNYWADWTTPDVVERFGIVDLPYNITGTRGAKDYYPLTSPEVIAPPIPEFSEFIVPIVGLMLIALIFGRTMKEP